MNPETKRKAKCAFVLLLSLVILAGSAWEFRLGSYARIPIYLMGSALGFAYFLRGGRLPAWIYEGWDFFGYLGLKRDDDPKNIPSKYSLPLGIAILAAVALLAFYVVSLKGA